MQTRTVRSGDANRPGTARGLGRVQVELERLRPALEREHRAHDRGTSVSDQDRARVGELARPEGEELPAEGTRSRRLEDQRCHPLHPAPPRRPCPGGRQALHTDRARTAPILRGFGTAALWLGASIACLVCDGCWSTSAAPPKDQTRTIIPADGGRPVTSSELDELTRAFADRYVGLLYSACDELLKNNPDPGQRREAQRLLVDCSGNIYDIASNADSFTRLLDLVVVTNLISQTWVDDGRAAEIFGDRAQLLTDAMQHARSETQALAARVLTVEQLEVLQSLLADWRKLNPQMIRVSFVRFSNFAVGRGRSAASEVLATRGFFADVGQARQAVDEARLLAERMFYMLKREPTLLRWQIAAAQADLFATPEVTSAVADLHRLADVAEQLPALVANEREAILAAVDSRMAGVDATVAKVATTAAELRSLVESLEPATTSLDRLLETLDELVVHYDAWYRFAVANRERSFDVREYTEAAQKTATASRELNALIETTNGLLGSPEWNARIEDLGRSADGRIEHAAAEGRLLLDDLFRRIYFAVGGLFVLLVCYRLVSVLLTRALVTRGRGPDSSAA